MLHTLGIVVVVLLLRMVKYSSCMVLIRSTRAGLQLHGIKPLKRCVPDRLPAGFSWWTAAEFLAPLLRGEQLIRSARRSPGFRRTHLSPVKSQDEHALQGFNRFHQRKREEWRRHCRNIYTKRTGETAGGQTRQVDRSDYFFLLFFPYLFFIFALVVVVVCIYLYISFSIFLYWCVIEAISDVISQVDISKLFSIW